MYFVANKSFTSIIIWYCNQSKLIHVVMLQFISVLKLYQIKLKGYTKKYLDYFLKWFNKINIVFSHVAPL